jgi:hypothetical protein
MIWIAKAAAIHRTLLTCANGVERLSIRHPEHLYQGRLIGSDNKKPSR